MSKDDFFPNNELNAKDKKKKKESKPKKVHIPLPKKDRKVVSKKREGQETTEGSPSKRIKTLWKRAKRAGKKQSLKGFAHGLGAADWFENKRFNRILSKKRMNDTLANIKTMLEEIRHTITEREAAKENLQ